MNKIICFMLAALLVLSFAACGKNVSTEREDPEIPEVQENPEQEEPKKEEFPETGERREVSPEDYENAVKIVLSLNSVTVDGKSADESDCVTVGGEIVYYHDMDKYESGNAYGEGGENDKHTEEEAAGHTLVTITKPGEYFITGELKGQLAVDLGEEAETDPEAKVTLIFGGADITCEIAPAVIFYNVYECADTEGEATSAVDTSSAGANVIIADGSLSNICGANVAKIYKDNGEEKKLHKYDGAFYSKMSMNIDGGEEGSGVLNIAAENEGLGSEMHLTINGGIIGISSKDDGINTNEDGVSVTTVNGGKLTVRGGLGVEGDGIDSNGWLIINGGTIFASGNDRSGDGGIDADMGISINGGTVYAFGGRNDYVDTESEQIFVRLDFASTRNAGSLIEFTDGKESTISVKSDREFQSVVLSGDMLKEDGNYSLYVDGVLQEYTSNNSSFEQMLNGGFGKEFTGGQHRIPDEHQIPEGAIDNPYAVPEGFEEWLENAKDIPKEIREWLETMAEAAKEFSGRVFRGELVQQGIGGNTIPNAPQSSQNGGSIMVPEEEIFDATVFVLERGKVYFSGICDSPSASGKERVTFTVNGESRLEDVYIGDIPEIESIECSEKVPSEQIQITIIYTGRDENITVSRSCLLSDGIEAVRKLFEGLEPGDYRLTIGVTDENEKYSGSTIFNFDVVE